MKGTEKQIKWASEIIATHNTVLAQAIANAEKVHATAVRNNVDTTRISVTLNELNKIATLLWDDADAGKIIDMRGWAVEAQDLGFGQSSKSSFNLPKFYNVMLVVFGMNSAAVNSFFGV